MNRFATVGALVMFCPLFCLAQDQGPNRLALVIGNSAYTSLPGAPSAIAEAHLISNALTGVGFEVKLAEDVTYAGFFALESEFLQTVHKGDICLFYYSGHGAQIIDDDDYLLPVDFPPGSDKEMQDRAFRLTKLIEHLENKQVSLQILI